MKRVVCSSGYARDAISKSRNARKALESMRLTKEQRDYVEEAYQSYISCYNTNSSPRRCKTEWLVGAVEDELFTEEEFERAFQLVEDSHFDDAVAYS